MSEIWDDSDVLHVTLSMSDAHALIGRTLAAIEEDCAQSWPVCPRAIVICDCRLRATRAVNALKLAPRTEVS